MYGGGPPFHLMWSGIFNPDRSKLNRDIDWKRICLLFQPYIRDEIRLLILIAIQSGIGLIPPLLTVILVDKSIPNKDLHGVLCCTGGMIAAGAFGGIISVYQGFVNARVAEGIMRDLRCRIVAHLQRMPIDFFATTKSGELLNRVSSDIDSLDDIVSGTLVTIVSNILVLASTMIAMFILDWRLAFLSLLLLPSMILPLWPLGKRMYKQRKVTRQRRDEVANRSLESLNISGVTLTKIFVMEQSEKERFRQLTDELMHAEIGLAMIGRWFMMVITFMTLTGPALLWLAGSYMVIKDVAGLGTVLAFIALVTRLYGPASALTGVQVQVAGALALFERIFDYFDMKEENYETGELIESSKIAGRISFEHVDFSYANQTIFNDLNLLVEPGQFVAIVGPSGAGKSTLANLIPRFYELNSGRICIDGKDIRDINLISLRRLIGMVTQETYLFHASIKENLLYANPQASENEIDEAVKAANIYDFISALPERFDTVTGERGLKLSGGERQRLSIARVILKNPRILILDEATSSLDSINETAVQLALNQLMKGRTSIVIAHRLSTVQNADKILVLDGGSIVEQGKHEELLSKNGVYARLYLQQTGELLEQNPPALG